MTGLACLRVDTGVVCGVTGLIVDSPLISYCRISFDLVCILGILLLFSARLMQLVRIVMVHGCCQVTRPILAVQSTLDISPNQNLGTPWSYPVTNCCMCAAQEALPSLILLLQAKQTLGTSIPRYPNDRYQAITL